MNILKKIYKYFSDRENVNNNNEKKENKEIKLNFCQEKVNNTSLDCKDSTIYGTIKKIFYIKNYFICFANHDSDYSYESFVELRNGSNFNFIKNIELNSKNILDCILFSKNEIIYINKDKINHEMIYFKLDNEYNICNRFKQCFLRKYDFARLELFKNKKIIWIEGKYMYIFSINIKYSNFICETKIIKYDVCVRYFCFYEIKSRNEIICNIRKEYYLSILDSNSFKIKKLNRFQFDPERICILNDNYFLYYFIDSKKLRLISIINFECIKIITFKKKFGITMYPSEKNTFILFFSHKKWKFIFDDKKLDFNCIGYLPYGNCPSIKILGSKDLYIYYSEEFYSEDSYLMYTYVKGIYRIN